MFFIIGSDYLFWFLVTHINRVFVFKCQLGWSFGFIVRQDGYISTNVLSGFYLSDKDWNSFVYFCHPSNYFVQTMARKQSPHHQTVFSKYKPSNQTKNLGLPVQVLENWHDFVFFNLKECFLLLCILKCTEII